MARAKILKIGLDFDNTIVCYDAAIEVLADELLDLPLHVSRTKLGLRNYLHSAGRELDWTIFQGALYGPGMVNAQPFDGAIETMHELILAGYELIIVSHRSRFPYAGPLHDLHAAARCWVAERLQVAGLFTNEGADNAVNFLETRDEKVATIGELKCDVFLDDLPEVLDAPGFSEATVGVLFAPFGGLGNGAGRIKISSWDQFPALLGEMK